MSDEGLDLTRLGQILGMLGSAHDGEIVNAAKIAVRMVQDAGLTWPQLLTQNEIAVEACRRLIAENEELRSEIARLKPPPPPVHRSFDLCDPDEQRELVLLWIHRLNNWEQSFIWSLPRAYRLSARQRIKLSQIATKCDRLAREAAQ
jgi:hypothetical protein